MNFDNLFLATFTYEWYGDDETIVTNRLILAKDSVDARVKADREWHSLGYSASLCNTEINPVIT